MDKCHDEMIDYIQDLENDIKKKDIEYMALHDDMMFQIGKKDEEIASIQKAHADRIIELSESRLQIMIKQDNEINKLRKALEEIRDDPGHNGIAHLWEIATKALKEGKDG